MSRRLYHNAKETFAASSCLWWFGGYFLGLAPYNNDARSLTLSLLGGNTGRTMPYGFHDWEFTLKELGLLRCDHFLAQVAHKMDILIILTALL